MAGHHPLSIQIRVHHLNENENLEHTLFSIKKGSVIQFKLGSTLFGQSIKFFINYPENPTEGFKRLVYRELKWRSDSLNKGDDTALHCDVTFELSGSFHYFFIPEGGNILKPSGSSILCITYLAKCLGSFDKWEERLRTAKEVGYNMIHITPIQQLGDSDSSYSLRNQLKLNPIFDSPTKKCTLNDISALVEKMRKEWKIITITDIVLNHTANESEWLLEHPESTYNLVNSPHLRPAYLLDRALWYFSLDIAAGKWTDSGIPPTVNSENHLNAIRDTLKGYYRHQLKLHEFFLLHIDNVLKEFAKCAQQPDRKITRHTGELKIIPDPEHQRLKSTINMQLALSIYAPNKLATSNDVNAACDALRWKLEELNNVKMAEFDSHFYSAVENVISAVRYERLSADGPHLKFVSAEHPLVPQYFRNYGLDQNLIEDEKLMFSPQSCYIMAHNGWVMGDNPLKNFAEPGSNVYLRRELVAWGDSVKLRYGDKPEDSPFLWKYMTEYIQQLSRVFYGLRLDNCHSTPIHVAEFLIDKAREVRPDLFVVAELFTSSEAVDNIFVNRLGITALIRESMQAPDSHEQGRLVYRYGGSTVGAFMHPITQPLKKCIAHAVFMDITHDNQCPMQIRSVYDYFPTASMVSMACCATGSTWGYDQLVPHHIHVVSEKRVYTSWTDDNIPKKGYINAESGIIAGKRALNKLHFDLGTAGFTQVFVDQRDENTVAITRHCPATHQSVIMIARTAFRMPAKPKESSYVKPLRLQGTIEEIILEGGLEPINHNGTTLGPSVYIDDTHINGLSDFKLNLREHIQIYESEMIESAGLSEDGYNEIDFVHFPPGSVIVLRISLDPDSRAAILRIRSCVSQFGYPDLNKVLFKCDAEERDEGKGRGAYNLPEYGDLVYCGLQGVMSELMNIRLEDDLGHPLCDNLRQGNWLPDYISSRLIDNPSTHDLGKWFDVTFESLRKLPRYLVPCYFDTIITGAYSSLLSSMWRKMSDFVSEGSTFVKALAMGSVILCGIIRSAPLPRLSPHLDLPIPPTESIAGQVLPNCVTISAGLPHFSTGYMRNWGRDTFISLRGLLLVTGRHDDARFIILAFAACLTGLTPIFWGPGRGLPDLIPKDSVWWWLQSIQDYVKIVPTGHKILKDKVSRLFPTDDSPPLKPGACDQPLHDVIHEALQKHFQGLKFRERNAGRQLDEQMSDAGFNNEIGVDLNTGFVFGGNSFNCGTWMDKMGSSEKAGNKGKPATPRDGSAVEIVGLSKSALRWLNSMFHEGHYPYCMVEHIVKDESTGLSKTIIMTYKEWNDLIQANFDKNFFVNPEKKPDDSKLINKRGIYKDTFNSSLQWADYQLRPNYPIAMCVAPELFDPQNAWLALRTAEQHLLGPLGMKTLDPSDWGYDGFYDNSDDSMNQKRAKGWNYHQGPEWLWPVGYFLRAKLIFSKVVGGKQEFDKTLAFIKKVMSYHFLEIQKSKWRGLPELTNKDGAYCRDSCVVQAWSHATLLEVLFEMDALCSNDNTD
ncbi:glycogen debranching enzyme [Trichonephila inaurata madagascariensis]|uniref:Glycogen debranching enzyme n=1 Tax=Trichonephila inaurata madagascariensis TaxID=2747483 RepID=A0A8X6IAZ8_9ARAC|nr:glycogen debranching enzyme [Trichonephila inaurata madagascariensis]